MKELNVYWFEGEIQKQCSISKERFHKVKGYRWPGIYQNITEKFADKTKVWKNGLHWANTNGYSPKSMKNLLGCYPVDHVTWFQQLPQVIPQEEMVYFLIDCGSDWYGGEEFWIFEGYVPELIKALMLLNQTFWLDLGWRDYYLVSKKYKWIIGFNHHDVVSFVGEGIDLQSFQGRSGT